MSFNYVPRYYVKQTSACTCLTRKKLLTYYFCPPYTNIQLFLVDLLKFNLTALNINILDKVDLNSDQKNVLILFIFICLHEDSLN